MAELDLVRMEKELHDAVILLNRFIRHPSLIKLRNRLIIYEEVLHRINKKE